MAYLSTPAATTAILTEVGLLLTISPVIMQDVHGISISGGKGKKSTTTRDDIPKLADMDVPGSMQVTHTRTGWDLIPPYRGVQLFRYLAFFISLCDIYDLVD
jgi:hypothetical protein